MKTNLKKTKKIVKLITKFLQTTFKNYKKMKIAIKKVLLMTIVLAITSACNVTRKITTESSYFQKGDTTCTIVTKTTETYDATKKL